MQMKEMSSYIVDKIVNYHETVKSKQQQLKWKYTDFTKIKILKISISAKKLWSPYLGGRRLVLNQAFKLKTGETILPWIVCNIYMLFYNLKWNILDYLTNSPGSYAVGFICFFI